MKMPSLLAVSALVLAGAAHAGEVLIDDFESAGAPAPWTFDNGSEFPGAAGSLSLGPGWSGHGARLAYDFSQGGNYVQVLRTLNAPLVAAAIGFRLRSPAGARVGLRVVDQTGQTLQYSLARPLQALDANAWYRQVVALNTPSAYWGGANDGVVHGDVTVVAILAGNSLDPSTPLVGAIDLAEIVAVDSLAVAIDPAAALDPPPAGVRDLTDDLGVNIHFTQDDRALDIARSAGLSWIRMDLFWPQVEQQAGQYDFSGFDPLVAALAARGMHAHFILGYDNRAVYPDSNPPLSATAIQEFSNYAVAAAAHFAGNGIHWEVWNEANGNPAWTPQQYAALADPTITAMHVVDPTALVSTSGLAGLDIGFLHGELDAGAARNADAIAVHPYGNDPPEALTDGLLQIRAIAGAAAPGKPIWDTEWGFSSSNYGAGDDPAARKAQAVRVVREFAAARAVGFAYPIYYDLRDDCTDPANAECNFGLIGNDYSAKPALLALQTLVASAHGKTFAGFLPLPSSFVHGLRFDGAGGSVVMLWTERAVSSVPVTLPAPATAIDMLGAPLALTPVGAGTLGLTLTERDGPVYLSLPLRDVIFADGFESAAD